MYTGTRGKSQWFDGRHAYAGEDGFVQILWRFVKVEFAYVKKDMNSLIHNMHNPDKSRIKFWGAHRWGISIKSGFSLNLDSITKEMLEVEYS